jgi:hypothetical protein
MKGDNKLAIISVAVLAGICFQFLLIFADNRVTPEKAAVEFSKAYFALDPKMGEWIADERKTVDDVDLLEQHFQNIQAEAIERGCSLNWLKSRLSHVHAYTVNEADDRIQIRITAKRRTAINPVYVIVADLFNIGDVHQVDEVIEVINEEGQWKVTGPLYSFPVS